MMVCVCPVHTYSVTHMLVTKAHFFGRLKREVQLRNALLGGRGGGFQCRGEG